jgi:hypothetical protein
VVVAIAVDPLTGSSTPLTIDPLTGSQSKSAQLE